MKGSRKYQIKISPSEKELYRIFKDLELYGRCAYSYPEKQKSVSLKLSKKCDPFIKRGLMYPPVSNYWSNQSKEIRSYVQLPIKVSIREKRKGVFGFSLCNTF